MFKRTKRLILSMGLIAALAASPVAAMAQTADTVPVTAYDDDDSTTECTITFDANADDAEGSMDALTVTAGGEATLSENAFTRTGYTFDEWNTDEDGDGTSYENGGTITVSEDTTLYAQWDENYYSIAFDANGGSGTMDTIDDVSYTQDVSLTDNAFTYVDENEVAYTFVGWNTKSDGTGTSYADGETVSKLSSTDDDTVTLYAQWAAYDYTVTFKANYEDYEGNDVIVGYKAAEYEGLETWTLSDADTLFGYRDSYEPDGTFIGWSTSEEYTFGESVIYTAGDYEKSVLSGLFGDEGTAITLYAQWTACDYGVVFDANGGEGTMESQGFSFNETQALTANVFTKTGYTFAGWNTESDGSGDSYADCEEVENLTEEDGGLVTLYAQWTANTYTIKFKSNGGSGTMSSITATYDEETTLTANAFARSGYKFNGWNTAKDGSGDSYADGATVTNLTSTNGATVTLYAQWKKSSSTSSSLKAQTIKVKGNSLKKTFKANKKTQKLKKKKTFKVKATTTGNGKITYAKKSGNKKITVNKKGKVTVKKGLKKGTYKVKVKVTAAKTSTYVGGADKILDMI